MFLIWVSGPGSCKAKPADICVTQVVDLIKLVLAVRRLIYYESQLVWKYIDKWMMGTQGFWNIPGVIVHAQQLAESGLKRAEADGQFRLLKLCLYRENNSCSLLIYNLDISVERWASEQWGPISDYLLGGKSDKFKSAGCVNKQLGDNKIPIPKQTGNDKFIVLLVSTASPRIS